MAEEFKLSICVDFGDDLLYGWFDDERFRALFNIYRSWGATRIYWIYAPYERGAMTPSPWAKRQYNADMTYQNVGEFLPAATRAAHDCGLEMFAVFKPFDLSTNCSVPFGSEAARKFGKGLDCISGPVIVGLNDFHKLADKRIERDMSEIPSDLAQRSISRIRLTAFDRARGGPKAKDISITVSDDNGQYSPYEGRIDARDELSGNRRIILLDGLDIDTQFLALHCSSSAGVFKNCIGDIIRLFDSQGRELPCTLGLLSRRDRHAPEAFSVGTRASENMPLDGYCFNVWNPALLDETQNQTVDVSKWRVMLDNPRGYLALAKGKERYVAGAPSPMYPDVQEYWMGHVRDCLAAGVDGVDLRVANHNRCLEWDSYGYEQPVVEEYERRHGAVSKKSDMDIELRRQIIADAYSGFYSSAADMVRGAGKRMQLHVRMCMNGPHMGLKWDWMRWLNERLADEITLKDAEPNDQKPFTGEVRAEAKRLGIPVHSCPWYCRWEGGERAAAELESNLRAAREKGESGFILYESAYFVNLDCKDEFKNHFPEMSEMLRRMFGD